jgi:hypothetical protein
VTATVTRISRTVLFDAPGGWQVRIISYRCPGDSSRRMQFYWVRRNGNLVKATTEIHQVRRAMGSAFDELTEVAP